MNLLIRLAKKRIFYPVLFVCLTLLWTTGCTIQRDMVNLQERMIAAERQNQELQRQNAALKKQLQDEVINLGQANQNAEKNVRTQYASMNVNLDTFEQDLRLLTGRIEEIEYTLNRKLADSDAERQKSRERIDELSVAIAKSEQRLSTVERYLSMDRKSGSSETSQQPSPPVDLYGSAKQAFDKGEWEKARQLFGKLLKEKPQSENADNAQFWIGETYYNEQWFEKAILEYQTVIEQYPKGNKVPAAMLKQGMAFLRLGDQSNARLVLKRLTEKYPQTNEASIAVGKLKDL